MAFERLAGYPLLDALLGRRSRRFAPGLDLDGGPLTYASTRPPAPLTSIQAYGAVVRMRSEFIKRLYVANKGLFRGAAPIGGQITVVAVDLGGNRWKVPVKDVDRCKPFVSGGSVS